MTAPHIRQRFKVRFADLLCPDGYWPCPLSLEQAFEVFRWMVTTGDRYRCPQGWGPYGPRECLSLSSGVNMSSVEPIRSIGDLKSRFVAAFFSRHGGSATLTWRAECGIHPERVVWIAAPNYAPFGGSPCYRCEADIFRAVSDLLGARVNLLARPNPCHHAAIEIVKTSIAVTQAGFRFWLDYGYEGSQWDFLLARSEPGEPFTDTLDRATRHLALLRGAQDIAPIARLAELRSLYVPGWDGDSHLWQQTGEYPVLDYARQTGAAA